MKCPHCGATVRGNRLDCPRCGRWLDERPASASASAAAPSNKPLLIALMVILAALLVVTFLAFTGKLGPKDPAAEPVAAVTAAPETEDTASAVTLPPASDLPETTETPAPTPTPEATAAPTVPLDPGHYVIPDSASRALTEADLESLSDRDLMLARNEIFARHGFIFTTQWIQGYFLTQGWYTPTTPANQFDSGVFNAYERANIDLILRVEAERTGE